jgi:hypothetical protein
MFSGYDSEGKPFAAASTGENIVSWSRLTQMKSGLR